MEIKGDYHYTLCGANTIIIRIRTGYNILRSGSSTMFSSRNFIVFSFTSRYISILNFYFFADRCPLIPRPFVEKTILPPLSCPCTFSFVCMCDV